MKTKNFALLALLIAIVIVGILWLSRPAADTAAKPVAAPIPAMVDAPKQVAPPSTATPVAPPAPKPEATPVAVAQPIAAPVSIPEPMSNATPVATNKSSTTSPVSVTTQPDASADPHNSLNTALADMARLLRNGDLVALQQTYHTPDVVAKADPQRIQRLQAMLDNFAKHPDTATIFNQQNEAVAEGIESVKDQPPTYNATGDEATYTFTVVSPPLPGVPPDAQPPQRPRTIVMIKIDSKWYAKSGL